MIRSFAHRGLQRFFERGSRAGIQPAHARRLRLILAALDAAGRAEDLLHAHVGLHRLHGALEGHWAVSVNGPWRLTFRIEDGDAWQVDSVQYH
jgi:proteic killer suppression protein